jgi:hypothetical protein
MGAFKTKVKGNASVLRGGQNLPAGEGMRLFEWDTLKTGDNASLGMFLHDDSRLSLGANAEISVDRFVFAPAQKDLNLVLRMIRGAVSYISGKIAELSSESVHFQTPAGIVGVRGAHFAVKLAPQQATVVR